MANSKRIQRPRLETSSRYLLSGNVGPGDDAFYNFEIRMDKGGCILFDLPDARRLHKFLGRAISYLEQRKAGRK